MVHDSSEDPSAKDNGGDLGFILQAYKWFTLLKLQPYNTKPGQVSMPVRTRFGYHIIKVSDIRPAVGEIHCTHHD